MLDRLVAVCLALGILPALMGLTPALQGIGLSFQSIKWGMPLLAFHVWKERKRIPSRLLHPLFLFAWVGMASIGPALIPCGEIPRMFFRETAVWLLCTLAATSFLLLPPLLRRRTVSAWMGILLLGVALDTLFPAVHDWMYRNVLDPDTRLHDFEETGSLDVWTGLWGRQSFAKLLTWIPFLWIAENWPALQKTKGWKSKALLGGALFLPLLSLWTSQRGPFLAAIAAVSAVIIHRGKKDRVRAALFLGGAICLVLLLMPKDLLKTRFDSLFVQPELGSEAGLVPGGGNQIFRYRILKFSWNSVKEFPLGNPCIPLEVYRASGFWLPSHSHNLFLHPFRERGWLFGALHLFLWVFAGLALWKRRTLESGYADAARFGAWVSVVLGGMTDYPWAVIHQALPLSILLWSSFETERKALK